MVAKSKAISPSKTSPKKSSSSSKKSVKFSTSPPKVEEKEKSKKKKIDLGNFSVYVYQVLKQVHPDTGMTSGSLSTINSCLKIFAKKISKMARKECQRNNVVTVSSAHVRSAVRKILAGELGKHAIAEGTKALTKYVSFDDYKGKGDKTRKTRQRSCGLTFSVSRCEHYLRDFGASLLRVSAGAPVFLTAVIEYLCAELVELSGNLSRDNKRVLIKPRDLFLSVENDEELKSLFKRYNIIIHEGGVIPMIYTYLLPERDEKGNKKYKTKSKGKGGVHKFRPGTRSLMNIRKHQKTTKLLGEKAPFKRSFKRCMDMYRMEVAYKKDVILLIQSFVENNLTRQFQKAQEMAKNANYTITPSPEFFTSMDDFVTNRKLNSYHTDDNKYFADGSIKRISERGGVKILSKKTSETARRYVGALCANICRSIAENMMSQKVKTVSPKILSESLADIGYNFVF